MSKLKKWVFYKTKKNKKMRFIPGLFILLLLTFGYLVLPTNAQFEAVDMDLIEKIQELKESLVIVEMEI